MELWLALAGVAGAIATKLLDLAIALWKGQVKSNSAFKVELLHAEDRFRESLMAELEAMRDRVSALEAALADYERENKELTLLTARLEAENKTLRQEVEDLRRENQELREELEQLRRLLKDRSVAE